MKGSGVRVSPSAYRDAVLGLPGQSAGADQDVAIAQERGIPVYRRVEEIPGYGTTTHTPSPGSLEAE